MCTVCSEEKVKRKQTALIKLTLKFTDFDDSKTCGTQ